MTRKRSDIGKREGTREDRIKEDGYGPSGTKTRMTNLITVSMTGKDAEIVTWLTEFLGTSRSEAIRTAVRAFAGQMKAMDTDLRGRTFDK